jgi:hypothetical protein
MANLVPELLVLGSVTSFHRHPVNAVQRRPPVAVSYYTLHLPCFSHDGAVAATMAEGGWRDSDRVVAGAR